MAIFGLILLLIAVVIAFQNPIEVTVKFLQWSYPTSLGLALISAAVVGAIIIYISGWLGQRDLRAQLRVAESKLRDLERQRQAAPGETVQGPRG